MIHQGIRMEQVRCFLVETLVHGRRSWKPELGGAIFEWAVKKPLLAGEIRAGPSIADDPNRELSSTLDVKGSGDVETDNFVEFINVRR